MIQDLQELNKADANHLNTDSIHAAWNLQKHVEILYYIGWVHFSHSIKHNIWQISLPRGRFDGMDDVVDKAAASEGTHPKNKLPLQG